MSRPERPSDDLLLQLVREGRHDAEIAVRLGVTTGELRERKIDLRNRLGTRPRQGLAAHARERFCLALSLP
jgi:DNA-binding NarL/FixJ family response regulator